MRAGNPGRVLEVDELSVAFGGLLAVDAVTFEVHEEERIGLIGPNGAGKSTILNAINRLVPARGSVRFYSESEKAIEILTQRPYRLREMGIARTFQSPQLVEELTIEENIGLGTYASRHGCSGERINEVLEACALLHWRTTVAADAPHGVKKLADLARCLMSPSRLLLLDEPGAGLSRKEKDTVVSVVRSGLGPTAVVMVDHDMDFVKEAVDAMAVMDFGQLIIRGRPEEVLADPEVRSRYFGM